MIGSYRWVNVHTMPAQASALNATMKASVPLVIALAFLAGYPLAYVPRRYAQNTLATIHCNVVEFSSASYNLAVTITARPRVCCGMQFYPISYNVIVAEFISETITHDWLL